MRLVRLLAAKLLTGIVMIWVVASATFFLVLDMPGNPAQAQEAQDVLHGMTPQQAERATAAIYGFIPKQPLADQYGRYLWGLLHGNLGESIAQEGTPVAHIVATAFPWTVILALSGILISFLIGVGLGVLAAIRRSTVAGDALTFGGAVINGIPVFVISLLLFYLFTTVWAIFPQGGNVSILYTPGWNAGYIGSVVSHAVLPVIAYILTIVGAWILTTKSSVISVLGDDFILAAELRGLKPSIVVRYITRNAMLPLFTILAIALGLLFSGSVFIEDVFNYPGLGQLMISSINTKDFPVLDGAFLLIIVAVIVANILADLAYPFIDPRIRR
ncbi:MAG TPA: ABC transporter permease [Trebonia sp.]|jgi:peptide/nickel transport system permease protein|nr:ABC transporter permease [Trebonia sp.]